MGGGDGPPPGYQGAAVFVPRGASWCWSNSDGLFGAAIVVIHRFGAAGLSNVPELGMELICPRCEVTNRLIIVQFVL